MSALPLSLLPAGASVAIRVLSAVVSIPWRGVWYADLDLDPDADAVASTPTSGKATLTIGVAPGPVQTLQGTIDPRYSGSFAGGVKARLVAGGGGWDKPVTAQDFSSVNGVRDVDAYSATAALVGETVNVPSPTVLGTHVVRTGDARGVSALAPGPASRILGDRDWYVDFTGVTQVASRAAATADPSMQIMRFEALEQRAELTCDTLVLPGTTLTDPRLGQTPIVRDVECIFDGKGNRITAWCAPTPVSRSAVALKAIVREYAGVANLKIYRYRYVQASSGGAALQAVDPSAGAPDLNPIAQGTGLAGALANLAPSTICYVAFVAGRPNDPILFDYDPGWTPINATVDATGTVNVGPSAQAVELAGGSNPVARLGDQVQVFLPPTLVVTGTISGFGAFTGTIAVVNPISGAIVQGSPTVSSK